MRFLDRPGGGRLLQSTRKDTNLTSRLAPLALLVALTFVCAPVRASADTDASPSPSPAPQLPPRYLQAEEEFSPDYSGETGSSTVLNVSGQTLIASNRYLLRIKLPLVTSAPAESVTGAGDLALTDLRFFDTSATHYVAGFTARVPTGQDSSLGSGKYSIGPAFGYQYQWWRWRVGFYTQNYFSFMGPSSRAGVGKSKIEPIVSVNLPHGWNVGLSSMSFTYDWELNKWTAVPVGARVTKGFGRFKNLGPIGNVLPLEATLEIEENLSRVHDTPQWTGRLSMRWVL